MAVMAVSVSVFLCLFVLIAFCCCRESHWSLGGQRHWVWFGCQHHIDVIGFE